MSGRMKRGFNVGMVVYGKDKPKTYYVELWEQPILWRLMASIYHWYDMNVHRLPLVTRFETWRHRKAKGNLDYIPIDCRRDLRCYHLGQRSKIIRATFEISHEKYLEIFSQGK